MPWKVGEDGNVTTIEGKPVFVHPDGKEVPFDGEQALTKISSLQAEAKTHREAAEQAKQRLTAFEQLGDAATVQELVERAKKIDAKKLIDMGEVDRLKTDWQKSWDEKVKSAEDRATKLEQSLYDEKVGSQFANSKYVTEKLMLPPDMVRRFFGEHFKIEEGRVVGYLNGTRLTSRERLGEPAGFEEALEAMVAAYPHKDRIMKAPPAGGSGAAPSQTPSAVGPGNLDLSKLNPTQRAALAFKSGQGRQTAA